MIRKNITRTAAIIYSEESSAIKSSTIQRKIIESLFIENDNKELSVNQIIDELKSSLEMDFDIEEVENIINDTKKPYFDIRFDRDENYIKLEKKRFDVLAEREKQNSIYPHVEKFKEQIYDGVLSTDKIDEVLHKYFYELLNKNISVFRKISKPTNRPENLFIDPNIFCIEERKAINSFLEWDEINKNKSIFALISYTLEYAVITNHHESSSIFLNSIKNKVFFLDNNILYRAIGLNGENRKRRILTFLQKCKSAGQEFKISKYSEKEFRDTIKHHIKLLEKVPFKRINYTLFSKYSLDPSIYEFYHKWKAERTTYSFDLFAAYVLSELDNFQKEFKVETYRKIPFDEKKRENKAIIDDYQADIGSLKGGGREQSHFYDAINIYLIEKLRGSNNNSIADTKYFFVSADQKLRSWDFTRNDLQPIALIPSQWMAVLLKYFSRTDNDYSSFISFLKLKTNQPIISSNNLQTVLAGISEITVDFERQETILDKMVELKFEGILNGDNNTEVVYKNTIDFVSKEFETELKKLNFSMNQTESDLSRQKIVFKEELLKEKTQTLNDLTLKKIPITKLGENSWRNYKLSFIFFIIIYYFLIVWAIVYFGWNKMEPITYLFGILGIIGTYFYIVINGESFDPKKYFETKKLGLIRKKHSDFNFNEERFNDLIGERDQLESEIGNLKMTHNVKYKDSKFLEE